LSIFLSVHPCVCQYLFLSIFISVNIYVCQYVCLSICMSVNMYVCPSVCLSVSLSVSSLRCFIPQYVIHLFPFSSFCLFVNPSLNLFFLRLSVSLFCLSVCNCVLSFDTINGKWQNHLPSYLMFQHLCFLFVSRCVLLHLMSTLFKLNLHKVSLSLLSQFLFASLCSLPLRP